jgi:polysaccharide export outer membrane protein
VLAVFVSMAAAHAADKQPAQEAVVEYAIGIDDVLDISILQPEKLSVTVTVSPDGAINFPYIGMVRAKGLTLIHLQEQIQKRLSEGYMKYPVVSVFLRENRSKKFVVYGEVLKPGTYLLDENTTVIKAISMAGGFTKFGSSSRVKVLRPKTEGTGYEAMKVNINAAMEGDSKADVVLHSGDIVVISEGVF